MQGPSDARGRRIPRFFLEQTPEQGGPTLSAAEQSHATRVLRLGPGDLLLGLDGRGTEWPLRVLSVRRSTLELEAAGAPRREPAPGQPGAPLPEITVAVPWPKGGRAEDMLAGLTALGAARLVPLVARFGGGAPPALSASRQRRLERAAVEACKQCERMWLPLLEEPASVAELAAAHAQSALVVLEPEADRSLFAWCAEYAAEPSARPLVLAIGPEGGFAPDEQATLRGAGAVAARLGPHVLRLELAAQTALAVASSALDRNRPRTVRPALG